MTILKRCNKIIKHNLIMQYFIAYMPRYSPHELAMCLLNEKSSKSVLNILLGFRDRSTFLADVQYLTNVNHASVAQKVLMALTELGIDFNDVLAVVTDSAAYMLKCHQVALSPVLPNSVHITCWAHVINLFGDTWVHICELKLVNTLVSLMKKASSLEEGENGVIGIFFSRMLYCVLLYLLSPILLAGQVGLRL